MIKRSLLVVVVALGVLLITPLAQAQDTSSDCPEAAELLPILAEFLDELADQPLVALDAIYEAVVDVASGGAQGIVSSTGCTALFEVSMADAVWELTFEKLR